MTEWEKLTSRTKDVDAIGSALAVIEWDQSTYMPKAGGPARGESSAVLSRLQHEMSTAPDVGEWLDTLNNQPLDPTQTAAVRVASRSYRRATALPSRLISDLAVARSDGFSAWIDAKSSGVFSTFEAPLQRLIDLTREQADRLGAATPGGVAHPYDALLESYDPGSTVADLRPMFSRLAGELNVLLSAIEGGAHPAPITQPFDADGLRRLSEQVMADLGFDASAGRLDLSEHPFSTGIAPGDTRITTHLLPDNFLASLGAVTHECGHGLYEQGLPHHLAGTGLNRATGFGMHESQSRFWENFIGRSLPFFKHLVPRMHAIWPNLTLTPDQLYGAANRVERSLIRIFADETTYNLHIIVRFEIELGILEGRLQARDLPGAWEEGYQRIVGVTPPDATQGVLQDVHWSSGYFGYFPSYTLGNLYAASLGAAMTEALPDLWEHVERGEFAPILGWLRTNVHQRGSMCDAPEMLRDAVGNRDPVADLVNHLWNRVGGVYGILRPR